MVEEVVQRDELARKLEALGRLVTEVEKLLKAQVELFKVDMERVPAVNVKLQLGRPIRDSLLAKLLALDEEDRNFVLSKVVLAAGESGKVELLVIVASFPTMRFYGVEIPMSGAVKARLIDLLALSLLREEDWCDIIGELERVEREWRGAAEKLRHALVALKVLCA